MTKTKKTKECDGVHENMDAVLKKMLGTPPQPLAGSKDDKKPNKTDKKRKK